MREVITLQSAPSRALAGLGKRLMYGTDQMIWPGMIERSIRRVEESDVLTKAQKRDILYNNAARFFRLEDAE